MCVYMYIYIYCYAFIIQWQIKIVPYLDPNSASDLGYVKSIENLNFIHFDVLVVVSI